MKLSTIKAMVCGAMTAGFLLSVVSLQAQNMAANGGMMSTNNGRGQAKKRKNWAQTHPARVQDNRRIRNQEGVLNKDLKSGKINQAQYNSQMKDLHTVQREENVDARANENGGHLTSGQQQAINQQLNESRKDINQDVNRDQWAKTHPARAKDNARIGYQEKLLKQDLSSGKINQAQYNSQMKDLHTVQHEENVDARANENGGHLTSGQQQAINQQLNESRQDINQDVRHDASASGGTAPTSPSVARGQSQSQWDKNHPARDKDLDRVHYQEGLLKKDLASGKITQAQYNSQMNDLHTIAQEQRVDAQANENGGHLTAGQQAAINQQLNESRKDINQDVNQVPPPAPAPAQGQ